MNFKKLADKAKKAIDERGGTERLKQDAERLKTIATTPGTVKDKAKAAGDVLKEPRPQPPAADADGAGAGAGAKPTP